MEPLPVTAYVIHSVFAGLWTGAVVFVTLGVVSPARGGGVSATRLDALVGTLTTVSRTSALALFATGSYMASARYTSETLTGTTGGYLVLAMLACWFLLAGVVEMGASKIRDGTGRDKVREPAREAWRFFQLGTVLAVALLVIAGLLSAGNVGFL